jgi:hypothetical protein
LPVGFVEVAERASDIGQRRKLPNVADIQKLPLIEVRRRVVGPQVIGVDQGSVEAVRGVVRGAAVGIGGAEIEVAVGAPQSHLQGVIFRVGHILERKDISEAGRELAQRIDVGIGPALHQSEASRLHVQETRRTGGDRVAPHLRTNPS